MTYSKGMFGFATLEVTQGNILFNLPPMPSDSDGVCVGADKRNYQFAPGLPPGLIECPYQRAFFNPWKGLEARKGLLVVSILQVCVLAW